MFFVKINRAVEQGATFIFGACLMAMLHACGSGAVSAPVADPAAGTALAVSPPTADLFPDLPTTFTITGGKASYTAFSSNSAVLPITASVSGTSFVVAANAVIADTAIDITVRDAANTSATAKVNVKPSSLNNQITFTPFGPTATGCGTNALCSGGDAQIIVKAVQNGLVLRNRSIRFDVFQGGFQLVTPSSGLLVNSLAINTDEQGEAVARITANAGAATQVATIQSTDVSSGLARRYNFNIVQQVSGVGILSVLPSAGVTITGAKGLPGLDGLCPSSSNLFSAYYVDYYVYGGTPPYNVVSPLATVASVSPGSVATNGGRFTAQLNGCGTVAFIVTDSTGRTIEAPLLTSVQGAKGDAAGITTATETVAPTTLTLSCNTSASVVIAGGSNLTGPSAFAAAITTAVNSSAFTISPTSGTVPGSVTFTRLNAGTTPTSIAVTISTRSTVTTVTATVPATCP